VPRKYTRFSLIKIYPTIVAVLARWLLQQLHDSTKVGRTHQSFVVYCIPSHHFPRSPLTCLFTAISARLASINIGGSARGFTDASLSPSNTDNHGRGDFGLIGLAVMGQNLILNAADHGFKVIAFNRTVSKVDHFLANEAKGKLYSSSSTQGKMLICVFLL
jgi:hypothetical protein